MLNKTGSSASIERITFDGCDEFPCVVHHGTSATGKVVLCVILNNTFTIITSITTFTIMIAPITITTIPSCT